MVERRPSRRVLLSLLLAGSLPGCGFSPVYGSRGDGEAGPAEAGLAAITVGPLPERGGQLLRQALQARFDRGAAGIQRRYDLAVAFALGADVIGIQQDNSVTRVRLIGSALWSLTAQDPQRSTLTSGSARAVDGYNIIDQQFFASDLESDMVQRRLAMALAEQITVQLAAFFKRRAVAG